MNDTGAQQSEVKDLVKQHWNGRAAQFDERPNHGVHSEAQHQAWLDVLGRLAGAEPLAVLDVGCGTGFLALMFAELGHSVTGIDFAAAMLEIAGRKAQAAGLKVDLHLADGESPREPDGSFDLVVARHVIWTLPDPVRGISEWQRVLKPAGRVGLIEGEHEQRQPRQDEYAGIEDQLPFYGGRPSEQLAGFLRAQGLHEVIVEPLMDAVLWGESPQRSRYLVVATKAL